MVNRHFTVLLSMGKIPRLDRNLDVGPGHLLDRVQDVLPGLFRT